MKVEHAKHAAFTHYMREARQATQSKYAARHGELLKSLSLACPEAGLKDTQSVYHVGYSNKDEKEMGTKLANIPLDKFSDHAKDLPRPRISELGHHLNKHSALWDYESMKVEFENGGLLLIETTALSHVSQLIGHVYIVHLPTLVKNDHRPDSRKPLPADLRTLARAAYSELGAINGGRKRTLEDDDDVTESGGTSPERSTKRARTDEPTTSTGPPEEDAMDLDTLPPFAIEVMRILKSHPAPAPPRIDASVDIDNVLFDRLPAIITTAAAFFDQTQISELIHKATQRAAELETNANAAFMADKQTAPAADTHQCVRHFERIIAEYWRSRAQVDEQTRIVNIYKATRSAIKHSLSLFFRQATPATREEQELLLAALHHLVHVKKQYPQLMMASLPRCRTPGCTELVHLHFGEPCCQHHCLAHRAPEHLAHVTYHAPVPVPALPLHDDLPLGYGPDDHPDPNAAVPLDALRNLDADDFLARLAIPQQ